MQEVCRQCQAAFDVADEDLAFLEKVSPVFHGKKELIPPPLLCHFCRLQRRLIFRNHNYVYVWDSPRTRKPIFSMWPKGVPFPVYENSEWFGGAWDACTYGREYHLSRPFFEQFAELRDQVPHFALDVLNMENSSYCNNASNLKNCYLVFNTNDSEDCMYCEHVWNSKDCMDCSRVVQSELCYNCLECFRCHSLLNSSLCDDCSESQFLLLCRSCTNCFGCVNLRRKQYCIWNEQKTRGEYEDFVSGLDHSSFHVREELVERFRTFSLQHPRPHVSVRFTEDVSGDFIFESRNVSESFCIRNGENLRRCLMLSGGVKDCVDTSLFGIHAELLYECSVCGLDAMNLRFCYSCWGGVEDLLYCYLCGSSSHCFGCVGLQRKQYCILNKQYSKEEYEDIVPRILGQMKDGGELGEFFPSTLSSQPYNRSLAQRYFPLSREEVLSQGFQWFDEEEVSVEVAVHASVLPDALPASDTSLVVRSSLSGRPFKITPQELKRLRSFHVPLPRIAYDERMEERARKLGGVTLYERRCAKTGKPILTTYPPDSPYIVWDKDVYKQEFGG